MIPGTEVLGVEQLVNSEWWVVGAAEAKSTTRRPRDRKVCDDLERDYEHRGAGPGRRSIGVRRAGRALPADRVRAGPVAVAQSDRGPGAGPGSVHPRHDQAQPVARSALFRRLV